MDFRPLQNLEINNDFTEDRQKIHCLSASAEVNLIQKRESSSSCEKESFFTGKECAFDLKWMVYWYDKRKEILLYLVHMTCSLIIFGHFASLKYLRQLGSVSSDAHRYDWQVIIPTLDFGSVHVVLFQMALIPLTMCRFSISKLSRTSIDVFLPMDKMNAIHYFLGHLFIVLVVAATGVFFLFYGTMCFEGEIDFCQKLSSEIFLTGLSIAVLLLVVLATSVFRKKIPYEVFYWVHHLVFLMFLLSIVHTFDNKERNREVQPRRSQAFKWISVPIFYYLLDRLSLYLNNTFETSVKSATVLSCKSGIRSILLKLDRPATFSYKPGQYAYLRVMDIDKINWHPFSMTSSPVEIDVLEFVIEVKEGSASSWSDKLYKLIQNYKTNIGGELRLRVDIMGPCGVSIEYRRYSHALMIGGNSGITPTLSALRHYLRTASISKNVIQDDPSANETSPVRSTEYPHRYYQWKRLLPSIIFQSVRAKLLSKILSMIIPIWGIILLGTSMSCNINRGIRDLLPSAGLSILFFGTIIFHLLFLSQVLYRKGMGSILFLIDVTVAVTSLFIDLYWYQYKQLWCNFDGRQLNFYSFLMLYMILRTWYLCLDPLNKKTACTKFNFKSLEFVWITRSSDLGSAVTQALVEELKDLAQVWKHEHENEAFSQICKVSIYITDANRNIEMNPLVKELQENNFIKNQQIILLHLGKRPNLNKIIQQSYLDRIHEDRNNTVNFIQPPTRTLLYFCGSPRLSKVVFRSFLENKTVAMMMSPIEHHQMDFFSESFS